MNSCNMRAKGLANDLCYPSFKLGSTQRKLHAKKWAANPEIQG